MEFRVFVSILAIAVITFLTDVHTFLLNKRYRPKMTSSTAKPKTEPASASKGTFGRRLLVIFVVPSRHSTKYKDTALN